MVAKIKTGRSVAGALNYNEHKVRMGKAELIAAQGYLKDPVNLSFDDKLKRITDLTERNERSSVNALHVSINFAVGELIDIHKLQQIADDYMTGLGFGAQPYLVYQHRDAAHPHLHIVSTNIRPDGSRISFHRLANHASEPARKQIEITYGLVKAEEQGKNQSISRKPLEAVMYGKSETKRAITNIVNEVLRTYRFTSIPEFNAVLNPLNVTADRGSKDSRMYNKNGLVYWILDEKGARAGVPVKASSVYGKPTLKTLEERFRLNEALRKPLKIQLAATLDQVMRQPLTKEQFQKALHDQGVQVLFRQNDQGRLYGVTFVDHRSKAVFNGSDLGKKYSAVMLAKWFQATVKLSPQQNQLVQNPADRSVHHFRTISSGGYFKPSNMSLIETLYSEPVNDGNPAERQGQRKKKKRKYRKTL